MTKTGRKTVSPLRRNAWDTMVEATEGDALATQAGEVDPGREDGLGGGDKGLDSETGPGGYGGDAVEAGYEEALAQPDRPLDGEIQGDPRTHADAFYPDHAKKTDPRQKPLSSQLEEDIEEEEESDEEDDFDEDDELEGDEDEDLESENDDDEDLESESDEDLESDGPAGEIRPR